MPIETKVDVTFCLADGTKIISIENLEDITTFINQREEYVKVVRCKDCKHCLIHDKILFCGYMGSIGEWRYRTETDYCSRAERKEVEECD